MLHINKWNDLLLVYSSRNKKFSVTIDADEKVCYAYLKRGKEYLGHVWLYNCLEAPETVDWEDKSQLPFLNPKKYCKDEPQKIIKDSDLVLCVWNAKGVDVFYDDSLFFSMSEGDKPGYSYNASLSNYLAKTFSDK